MNLEHKTFFEELQRKVEGNTVGIELWFDTEEWLRIKESGGAFGTYACEVVSRAL